MKGSRNIEDIKNILSQVVDPEIPVLTIQDIGMLREVAWEDDQLVITITPTYSGCPAMKMIEDQVQETLKENGYVNVVVKSVLSPAWTTDWMTDEAKKKLEDYGIAPPLKATKDKKILLGIDSKIRCPKCKSEHTEMVSQFGSTACKALYVCKDCKEPFDYFKCL